MSFSSSSYGSNGSSADKDLERFIEEENQKHRFQQTVNELNDRCWDICVDKPGQRLDSRSETCIANCVNRFLDASQFIVKRLEKVGQQHSEMEFSSNAIRRTLSYLEQGKLIFRKNVKVMTVHFNKVGDHHKGARDFVHWNLCQVMHKNPEVQVHFISDMFPTPFVRCWLDTGDDVIMDVFGKTNVQILDQLVKVLGQPKSEKLEMQKPNEIKKDSSYFGSGCERHCLCEIPGQFPCPCVVKIPKHMTGKYKTENNLYPKRGLYRE